MDYKFFEIGFLHLERACTYCILRVTSQGKETEAFVGCPIPGEVII
jgi:hypothetical protein